jgi:hypothetical protein
MGGKIMVDAFLSKENRETERINLRCGLCRLIEDEDKTLCKESDMVQLC